MTMLRRRTIRSSTRSSGRTRSTRSTSTSGSRVDAYSPGTRAPATRSTSCARARRRSRWHPSTTSTRAARAVGTHLAARSRASSRSDADGANRRRARESRGCAAPPGGSGGCRSSAAAAVVVAAVLATPGGLAAPPPRLTHGTGEQDAAAAFARAGRVAGARKLALAPANGRRGRPGRAVARRQRLPEERRHGALDAGHTYQLWALTGSAEHPVAISAGVLGADPKAAAFRTSGDVQGFAITIERAPGVAPDRRSRRTPAHARP